MLILIHLSKLLSETSWASKRQVRTWDFSPLSKGFTTSFCFGIPYLKHRWHTHWGMAFACQLPKCQAPPSVMVRASTSPTVPPKQSCHLSMPPGKALKNQLDMSFSVKSRLEICIKQRNRGKCQSHSRIAILSMASASWSLSLLASRMLTEALKRATSCQAKWQSAPLRLYSSILANLEITRTFKKSRPLLIRNSTNS